jgi:hypothetical protein
VKNDQERSALPLSLSVATERTDTVILGNRNNGQSGSHIDARYNGQYGHMYKEFKTNVGFY